MTEQLSSTGKLGPDFERPEGRAYNNFKDPISSIGDLKEQYDDFRFAGMVEGRRRTVFRARCTREVVNQIEAQGLPLEVVIPLNTIQPDETDCLVTLGECIHETEIPEWPEVYQYWNSPNGNRRQPLDRVTALNPDHYYLSNQVSEQDFDRLYQLWQPFGWTESGVHEFIEKYNRIHHLWFSSVVSRDTNQIVSACQAEPLAMAGILLVEGTEYGTLDGYEGNGFCTAAVSALYAQVLNETLYRTGEMPLIMSEFDMSSRSDVVGRHVGMTVPLVEGNPNLTQPIQVLNYNVSVLDRQPPNNLDLEVFADQMEHYGAAFDTPYQYWRNFIVGILPRSSVVTQYSPGQVQEMLRYLEGRN